ncbi:MAG: ABC transporter permease, partial [Alphaproteobacteria bacterium]
MTISVRSPAAVAAAVMRRKRRLAQWPPGVILAAAWIGFMLFVAIFADYLAPYGYTQLNLRARLAEPWGFGGTGAHLLGTDELGRDVLSRLIHP